MQQNYFSFNNKFFKQQDGLPMGSPLSPLLADIFMDNFESNLLNNKKISLISNIKFWYRYVDDVLCFWCGTDRQLDQ